MLVRLFFALFLITYVNTASYVSAAEILSQESVKNLFLRFQTVLNSNDKKDKELFFKYFSDSSAKIILANYILDPEDSNKELASENLTLSTAEFAKYLDLIRSKNYLHIYKVELGEVIIDSKSDTGAAAIAIAEFGLRKQVASNGVRINDMTILAATNCNVTLADNTNDVVITSMNCIGKIIEDPKPTPYSQSYQ
jgi:hypothetical protein